MPVIQLDFRTLLFTYTLLQVSQTIAMLIVWKNHSHYKPAGFWAMGLILVAIGVLMVTLRGLAPVWISVILANIFIIPGWMIFNSGIISSAGRRIPWAPGIAVSAAALSAIFWYGVFNPDYVMRVLIFSIAMLLFDGYTVYVCLKYYSTNRKSTMLIVGIMLLLLMASCIWRALSIFSRNLTSILTPDLGQTQFYLGMIFFNTIITIMLVLRTTQEMQDELNKMADKVIRQREIERDFAQIDALTDSLTRLWNRRLFDEKLYSEFYRARRSGDPLSLIMLDIDHFKMFNDRFGHLAGDDCLRKVAKAIKSVITRPADLAARYGGEEFVLVLPETDSDGAKTIAARVQKNIKGLSIRNPDSGTGGFLTASLGIATVFAVFLPEPNKVVSLADQALYRAKQGGRNRIEIAEFNRASGGFLKEGEKDFMQLVWNISDECGDPVIDEQHKELFESSNRLLSAFHSGRPRDECILLIEGLLKTIVKHFQDETAIIRKAGFPFTDEHILRHNELIEKARMLSDKYKRNELTFDELIKFLAYDLIARHILTEDRKFFPYIMYKGAAGPVPGEIKS